MEEKLKFLDEHYLSNFDYLDVDSVIQEQKAFEKLPGCGTGVSGCRE